MFILAPPSEDGGVTLYRRCCVTLPVWARCWARPLWRHWQRWSSGNCSLGPTIPRPDDGSHNCALITVTTVTAVTILNYYNCHLSQMFTVTNVIFHNWQCQLSGLYTFNYHGSQLSRLHGYHAAILVPTIRLTVRLLALQKSQPALVLSIWNVVFNSILVSKVIHS